MDAEWNGYQVLAWIAWRTNKAVQVFSGADAQQLWDAAKDGKFPKRLGRPKTPVITAEMQLQMHMQTGRIRYRRPT